MQMSPAVQRRPPMQMRPAMQMSPHLCKRGWRNLCRSPWRRRRRRRSRCLRCRGRRFSAACATPRPASRRLFMDAPSGRNGGAAPTTATAPASADRQGAGPGGGGQSAKAAAVDQWQRSPSFAPFHLLELPGFSYRVFFSSILIPPFRANRVFL